MSEAPPATATTAPATTTAPPATTTAPPATAAFDFSQHGVAGDDLAYVQNKGWKAPGDVIASYRNFEKLHGVPHDQIVKLPGAEATPEAWGEVWNRLGRPQKAEDYKFNLPEGDDGSFAKTAAGWMHAANLTQGQAAAIYDVVTKWGAEQAKLAEATKATAGAEALKVQTANLQKEWGPDKFDTNVAQAQRAAKAFGIDEATVDKLQEALGFDGVMKFMHGLGTKIGTDANFVIGDGKGGFEGSVTQEQARAQIRALQKDRAFAQRFNSSDPSVRSIARTEMNRLQQIAYPGQTEF